MFFVQFPCGIAVAALCLIDPVAHDRPRTEQGCREAAVQALGWTEGHRAACVTVAMGFDVAAEVAKRRAEKARAEDGKKVKRGRSIRYRRIGADRSD